MRGEINFVKEQSINFILTFEIKPRIPFRSYKSEVNDSSIDIRNSDAFKIYSKGGNLNVTNEAY